MNDSRSPAQIGCLERVQPGYDERRQPFHFAGLHLDDHPLHRVADRKDLLPLLVTARQLEIEWLVSAVGEQVVNDIARVRGVQTETAEGAAVSNKT